MLRHREARSGARMGQKEMAMTGKNIYGPKRNCAKSARNTRSFALPSRAWRNSCCAAPILEAPLAASPHIRPRSTAVAIRAPTRTNIQDREDYMNRRSILSTSALMALAATVMPSSVVGQQKSIKEQLVGTWICVSAHDGKHDGSKVESWGPNPKGAAMYDANGRFTFMIMRSDLPKFASNNRAQATAEEGKAVAQGMIAFYGTYTVNEADKTVTT